MTTRFAPSLTGYLHLGHVLHMIYVWGIARAKGAQVVSRIEDHDLSRRRPEYERAVLSDMDWLGFVPDRGMTSAISAGPSPFRQSDCSSYYEEMLLILAGKGLVYGCACSRKDIFSMQAEGLDELCYPGSCACKQLPLEGNTVRFRVRDGDVAFRDMALGECLQAPKTQCGDFSLRDRNGQWTYQFCCVCDDIRQGVDLVVRGEDILPSTGRQIQLMAAFGQTPPQYYHHRLLVDGEGRKLSKRQRSESIVQLRETGATAGEILGRAAHAGGLLAEWRPLSMPEATALLSSSR